MIKACIFDMDGTTVDSVKSIAYYLNETLKKYGYKAAPEEKYNHFAGNGPKKLVERAFEYVGADKSLFDTVLTTYLDDYNENPCHLSAEYEGITPMLEELKNQGIKIAIVSNKQHRAVKKISEKLFGNLVDYAVGAMENVPLKPAPDSLLNIMEELGVKKDEVLFVGDTNVDILTAKNAGVKSVGVLWGFRDETELRSAGADFIVSKPDEITALAKKMQ